MFCFSFYCRNIKFNLVNVNIVSIKRRIKQKTKMATFTDGDQPKTPQIEIIKTRSRKKKITNKYRHPKDKKTQECHQSHKTCFSFSFLYHFYITFLKKWRKKHDTLPTFKITHPNLRYLNEKTTRMETSVKLSSVLAWNQNK